MVDLSNEPVFGNQTLFLTPRRVKLFKRSTIIYITKYQIALNFKYNKFRFEIILIIDNYETKIKDQDEWLTDFLFFDN